MHWNYRQNKELSRQFPGHLSPNYTNFTTNVMHSVRCRECSAECWWSGQGLQSSFPGFTPFMSFLPLLLCALSHRDTRMNSCGATPLLITHKHVINIFHIFSAQSWAEDPIAFARIIYHIYIYILYLKAYTSVSCTILISIRIFSFKICHTK